MGRIPRKDTVACNLSEYMVLDIANSINKIIVTDPKWFGQDSIELGFKFRYDARQIKHHFSGLLSKQFKFKKQASFVLVPIHYSV